MYLSQKTQAALCETFETWFQPNNYTIIIKYQGPCLCYNIYYWMYVGWGNVSELHIYIYIELLICYPYITICNIMSTNFLLARLQRSPDLLSEKNKMISWLLLYFYGLFLIGSF